jgi:toxin ParE1/3/4
VKRARFLAEARSEFLDQVADYERIEPGLGRRFRLAVAAAVSLAAQFPLGGSPWKHGTRRVFPHRFPYSIVYRVEPQGIAIVAVAHFRRKPTYWRDREGAR